MQAGEFRGTAACFRAARIAAHTEMIPALRSSLTGRPHHVPVAGAKRRRIVRTVGRLQSEIVAVAGCYWQILIIVCYISRMAKTKSIPIVSVRGKMWARNPENIKAIPSSREPGGVGVYILLDGSMPVYVGQGNIQERIKKHQTKTWGQLWDRFSWFGLHNPAMMDDVEALMLKMLPPLLRSRNKRGGGFVKSVSKREENNIADYITRKIRP